MKKLITDGSFLVDVRTPAEFTEGNVQGSVNIPLNEIQQHLDKFKAKDNIVVYCRSGARSAQAKSILDQNGIANVTNGGSMSSVQNNLHENII